MKKLLFLLPIFLLFVACSDSNDEPSAIDFRLSSESPEISIDNRGKCATINVLGYETDYVLSISGDFVNIVFDADVDWLSAEYSAGNIIIHAKAIDNSNDDSRTGKVNFTVFNDSKSASGYISVTQRVITYEDLRNLEDKAIDFFLSKQEVIRQIPTNNNFQTGENAPFYILNSNPIVAMRVIDKGTEVKPKVYDRVYFRFSRANLLSYYQTGELKEDWNPILSASPCYFKLNDFTSSASSQWGKAIQMPFLYGLGYNSHVQLVVASPYGLTQEIAYVTPLLYDITYYQGNGNEHEEIPSSLVFLPFSTEADWLTFAPTSALQWQFFNKSKNIPNSYIYNNETATGFGGVLVVSDLYGMQTAYDAACPVECKDDVTLIIDSENMNAYCPECGSKYDVFTNYGMPISGKAVELRCAPVRYNIVSPLNIYKLITN